MIWWTQISIAPESQIWLAFYFLWSKCTWCPIIFHLPLPGLTIYVLSSICQLLPGFVGLKLIDSYSTHLSCFQIKCTVKHLQRDGRTIITRCSVWGPLCTCWVRCSCIPPIHDFSWWECKHRELCRTWENMNDILQVYRSSMTLDGAPSWEGLAGDHKTLTFLTVWIVP